MPPKRKATIVLIRADFAGSTVNGLECSGKILMFSAIAGASASVSAGELGSTSRSSIGVAVTIPTRLVAKALHNEEMAPGLTSGRVSLALCVVTNSRGATYDITLLPASETTNSAELSGEPPAVSLDWTDQSQGLQSANLRPRESLKGFLAADVADCSEGAYDSGKLTIKVNALPELALNGFREPVTLLIAPE